MIDYLAWRLLWCCECLCVPCYDRKTFAGFNVADFRSRWLRGKIWRSFRCPCLDELGSKSDLNILYLFFCCKMCAVHVIRTVRLMDD